MNFKNYFKRTVRTMPKGSKLINQGGFIPITICEHCPSQCPKQWSVGDEKTIKKLYDIHIKLEHPNCIKTNNRNFDVILTNKHNSTVASAVAEHKANIKARFNLPKPN